MEANGIGGLRLFGVWSPYLDGDIRRGRDQGRVTVNESDVVYPMGVGLYLFSKSRSRNLGLWAVAWEGVLRGGGGMLEIEIQVPRAYDTIAPSRIAFPSSELFVHL